PRGGGGARRLRRGPPRRPAAAGPQGPALLARGRRGPRRADRHGSEGRRRRGGPRRLGGEPDRLLAQRRQGLGAGQPAARPLRPEGAAGLVKGNMAAPDGFSWIDKPHLAALARPSSLEELTWLRRQGIELLVSLTEDRLRRDWVNDSGILV